MKHAKITQSGYSTSVPTAQWDRWELRGHLVCVRARCGGQRRQVSNTPRIFHRAHLHPLTPFPPQIFLSHHVPASAPRVPALR